MSSLTVDLAQPIPAVHATTRPKRTGVKSKQRRTTVSLSPEAMAIVAEFQGATGLTLSGTINELIERSQQPAPRIQFVNGMPIADIPMDGKWISTEDLLRAQAELG